MNDKTAFVGLDISFGYNIQARVGHHGIFRN